MKHTQNRNFGCCWCGRERRRGDWRKVRNEEIHQPTPHQLLDCLALRSFATSGGTSATPHRHVADDLQHHASPQTAPCSDISQSDLCFQMNTSEC